MWVNENYLRDGGDKVGGGTEPLRKGFLPENRELCGKRIEFGDIVNAMVSLCSDSRVTVRELRPLRGF